MNILYIEDDRRDADLARRALRKTAPAFNLDIATTQQDGLARLQQQDRHHYDLVLTDIHLPDGDGLSILAYIRQQALPLAVVIITGAGDEETAVAALKAGADDYIVKRTNYLAHLPLTLEVALQRYLAQTLRRAYSLNVLYAEHNKLDIDLTRRHLAQHAPHIHLEVVNTTAEIFQRISGDGAGIFDLLLLDYQLPGLNALEILKELNLMSEITVPVVLVTGQGNEEIVLQALKLGASDYVVKNAGYLYKLPVVLENAHYQHQLAQEQAALQASQGTNRAILNAIPDVMFRLSDDGIILDHRPSPTFSLTEATGELIGRNLTDVLSVEIAEQFMDAVADVLQDGRVQIFEYHLSAGQTHHYYEVRLARCGQKEALAIIRDMTEHRQLEEQLRQAHKMEAIGRLAGGIAHDFNNILTVITGYTDLCLRLPAEDDDPQRKRIEQIRLAAERAASLTHQLLAFSRQQLLQPRVLNLNRVINNLEEMLRRLIGEDIELIIQPDPALGNVRSDLVQMEQVIINLAVNARDAMPSGGWLKIETGNFNLPQTGEGYYNDDQPINIPPGPYVLLTMSDSGNGMDMETRAHMFEPFFTTKTKGEGTGLGLATVNGIVRQSGGYIRVHSQPGQGTRFAIYLPRVQTTVELAEKPYEASTLSPGSETILLVEDDDDVRALTHEFLHSNGYTVLEAGNSAEAKACFETFDGTIHLLLTDIVMPGELNGYTLAQQLQEKEPQLKVLFMSGYIDKSIVQEKVLKFGKAFLQKPFTLNSLAQKVKEALAAP